MKHILFGVLLFATSATPAFAEPSRKVQFRTLCITQLEGLEKVHIPAGKGASKNQEVALYTDISRPIEGVFTSNEAVFYTLKPDPQGKPMRVAVGKTALGKSARQLFVFAPGSGEGDGKLTYHVLAYDDDEKSFPLGSIRAINLSSEPVRFVMAGTPIPPILPGQSTQFPHAKEVNEYNMYPVTVEFQSVSGEWVKGQAASWKASDRSREVVVTSGDTKTQSQAVKIFGDFPPWLEKSKK